MNRRHRTLALALGGMLVLVAGCSGDSTPTTVPVTPSVIATAPVPTPTGSPESSTGAPSGTPHVVVTASPDEPVASTAFTPASELPEAILTRGDGAEFVLPIEVPDRSEYGIGLSGRLELGERGMLFWYPELTQQSFWMQNTHFDISIAFVGEDATIVEIIELEAESLETRRPNARYRYAIEAPAGWYHERGLGPGDQAVLDFTIPESLQR